MLMLTDNATSIVKSIAEQPDATGLRITGEREPQQSFAVAAAAEAAPDDQVVEQDGATVYLDTTAAELLADKVLDAAVDSAGNVQFALAEQT